MDKKTPLWMPEGSVRSLLAIIIVISCCSYSFVFHEIEPNLLALTMLVLSFYFEMRKKKEKENES